MLNTKIAGFKGIFRNKNNLLTLMSFKTSKTFLYSFVNMSFNNKLAKPTICIKMYRKYSSYNI